MHRNTTDQDRGLRFSFVSSRCVGKLQTRRISSRMLLHRSHFFMCIPGIIGGRVPPHFCQDPADLVVGMESEQSLSHRHTCQQVHGHWLRPHSRLWHTIPQSSAGSARKTLDVNAISVPVRLMPLLLYIWRRDRETGSQNCCHSQPEYI